MQFNIPIAYFFFNRPEQTNKSFSIIRAQKPKKLMLISDGPRFGNLDDEKKCKECLEIVSQIDWPCDVKTNHSDINLGMKKRNITGLNWAFSFEEELLILEDDNLPINNFFKFIEELAPIYRNNEKIFQITGVNWQDKKIRGSASYYFSKYNNLWGWLTWRRSWKKYDVKISAWPDYKKSNNWKKKCPKNIERYYWEKLFDDYYSSEVNSWAYAWLFAAFYNNGLTVTPNVNLVQNNGLDGDGTHEFKDKISLLKPYGEIKFPLTHPNDIQENLEADNYTFDNIFDGKKLKSIKGKFKTFFKRLLSNYI
jgi:hypothetical protein